MQELSHQQSPSLQEKAFENTVAECWLPAFSPLSTFLLSLKFFLR